jgi:hypothetical protein
MLCRPRYSAEAGGSVPICGPQTEVPENRAKRRHFRIDLPSGESFALSQALKSSDIVGVDFRDKAFSKLLFQLMNILSVIAQSEF